MNFKNPSLAFDQKLNNQFHNLSLKSSEKIDILSLENTCRNTVLNSLIVNNLSLNRDDHFVLKSINLSLQKGHLLLVTGASGSGKTSLAQTITGVIPQHYSGKVTGSISIEGLSPNTHSVEQLTQHIVCVFSDSWHRFFQITVSEELAFGPENLGFSRKQVHRCVQDVAIKFDLEHLLNARIDSLSGGQLQRVALAAAFAVRPKYIILDEPSSSLDRHAMDRLHHYLKQILATRQTGVLLLEHRLTEFLDIAENVMVLADGHSVFYNSVSEYKSRAVQLAHTLGIRHPGQREPDKWHDAIDIDHTEPTVPVLSLKNITAGYENACLKSINCAVYPGITALTGPNGSGKSTLAALIAGLIKPMNGSVNWPATTEKPRLPDGRVVGFLQQDAAAMVFNESIFSEIAEGPRNYKFPAVMNETLRWLKRIGLAHAANRHPLHLSSGQILRVAAAAVMILQPRILIMDEPSRGQDWFHLQALLESYAIHKTDPPSACILITHDYKIIHRYARRVIVLDQGQVKVQGKLRKNHDT